MARTVVVDLSEADPYGDLAARLKDPRPALRSIGVLMESASQKSFQDQALGDFKWPERYPNQSDPFINVAGAVSDWSRGATLKRRRFDRRPALIDTGNLMGSIRSTVVGKTKVETGTTRPYGRFHQHGLVSVQKVSTQVKQSAARFLLSDEGKPYRGKLLFLLNPNVRTLDTQINQRPFVGLTDELAKDITEATETFIAGGPT